MHEYLNGKYMYNGDFIYTFFQLLLQLGLEDVTFHLVWGYLGGSPRKLDLIVLEAVDVVFRAGRSSVVFGR